MTITQNYEHLKASKTNCYSMQEKEAACRWTSDYDDHGHQALTSIICFTHRFSHVVKVLFMLSPSHAPLIRHQLRICCIKGFAHLTTIIDLFIKEEICSRLMLSHQHLLIHKNYKNILIKIMPRLLGCKTSAHALLVLTHIKSQLTLKDDCCNTSALPQPEFQS